MKRKGDLLTDVPEIAGRYGNTKIIKLRHAVNELRKAIRAEGTPSIQDAWDRAEPWLDRMFIAPEE